MTPTRQLLVYLGVIAVSTIAWGVCNSQSFVQNIITIAPVVSIFIIAVSCYAAIGQLEMNLENSKKERKAAVEREKAAARREEAQQQFHEMFAEYIKNQHYNIHVEHLHRECLSITSAFEVMKKAISTDRELKKKNLISTNQNTIHNNIENYRKVQANPSLKTFFDSVLDSKNFDDFRTNFDKQLSKKLDTQFHISEEFFVFKQRIERIQAFALLYEKLKKVPGLSLYESVES